MVPIHGPIQSLIDCQKGSPSQTIPRFARIEFQILRLVGSIGVDLQFNTPTPPAIHNALY